MTANQAVIVDPHPIPRIEEIFANQAVIVDPHPIPRIEEIFAKMA